MRGMVPLCPRQTIRFSGCERHNHELRVPTHLHTRLRHQPRRSIVGIVGGSARHSITINCNDGNAPLAYLGLTDSRERDEARICHRHHRAGRPYLAELLLSKDYEVHGLIRRSSSFNTARIDHLYQDPHVAGAGLFLHYGDLADAGRITKLLYELEPQEVYHLGAQSHVRVSFDVPEYTGDVTGLGTTRLLDAIREVGIQKQVRFYQASSSELYGQVAETPQRETTPFQPRSPYSCAKLYAYWMTVKYREA